ncbi:hypothetical protein EEL35_04850 [Muribaculaceae bacterium Isolate-042 (Harlan)]|nr:hypothetical protein EEL35_04850 [Muribaculaceae bacterium Isolate-042 (Harlan)]
MLHSKNFADSIKAIKQYVEAGDYSRPHIIASEMYLEKAREFDPLGHAGFDPSGIIRLTP